MSWRMVIVFGFIVIFAGLIAAAPQAGSQPGAAKNVDARPWTDDFREEKSDLITTGRNPYFVLEPGFYSILKHGDEEVTKTVLNETKLVDGVQTRIIEEKETKGGQLVELSRNYYTISKKTNSIYYMGEDVDTYKNGKIDGHPGAWLSGVNGARFGMMMPGTILVGARHYQEVAPKVAQDRAEILSMTETITTPAGTFKNCLKVEETSPVEPDAKGVKYYASGIGLIKDDKLELTKHGFLAK